MNPLFNAINKPDISQLKSLFDSAKNPMALFGQLAKSNPALQPILEEMKNGKSPKEIALREMQKRGIDPNELFK